MTLIKRTKHSQLLLIPIRTSLSIMVIPVHKCVRNSEGPGHICSESDEIGRASWQCRAVFGLKTKISRRREWT